MPLLELPEHFREIDEEDADDRPVELPEERQRSLKHPIRTRKKMPDTITMGDLRKMRKQVEALTTMSSSVINTFALPLPLLFPYRNYTLNGRIKLVRTSRKGSGSGMTETLRGSPTSYAAKGASKRYYHVIVQGRDHAKKKRKTVQRTILYYGHTAWS